MAHFLPSRYKFYEHYACRGTNMIGAANLSPVTNLVAGTGPEYSGVQTFSKAVIYHGIGFKLRADARIRVQQQLQICLECRSTCLPAGRKAKSVTNNLPILSVLATGCLFRFLENENYTSCSI